MSTIRNFIRWDHWGESKLPFGLWAIASGFGASNSSDVSGVFITGGYTLFLLAFGFLYNDYCDVDYDVRAGKVRGVARLRVWTKPLPALTAFCCALGISFLGDRSDTMLMGAGLLCAVIYSGGALRLKEKGIAGVISAAVTQWSVPAIIAANRFNSWKDLWPFIIIGCLAGCRWMLIHQRVDFQNDIKSGQITFGTQSGLSIVTTAISWILRTEHLVIVLAVIYQLATGRISLACSLILAYGISIGAEILSPGIWNYDFSRVSLAFFYLVLAPLATYPFIPVIGLIMMVLHILLVKKFLVGEIMRCWYSIQDGEFRCRKTTRT